MASLTCGSAITSGRAFGGPLAARSGRATSEARLAAHYISPYVSRTLDEKHLAGLHRYEVAQGFQPSSIEVYGPTAAAAIGNASKLMGREPAHIWLSSDTEGWSGPPACWGAWN